MTRSFRLLANLPLLALLAVNPWTAVRAEDVLPAAKVLVIAREFTKPGKDGRPHQAIETAYPQAISAAKLSEHYYAAISLSGPPRVLFLHGYPSYSEWVSDLASTPADPAVSARLAGIDEADGDLLSSKDYTAWIRRDDLSLNPGFRVGTRMEVIIQYLVRPGHADEFAQLVNLYKEGYKPVPSMHWGTYEETYGGPGNAFLVIVTHKSAAELDAEDANDQKFADTLGPERLKKLAALEASCLESKQTDLFLIDPKMSYPTETMRKADPEFWNVATP
jgi:hypothetical protein